MRKERLNLFIYLFFCVINFLFFVVWFVENFFWDIVSFIDFFFWNKINWLENINLKKEIMYFYDNDSVKIFVFYLFVVL